jgi:hypothetical protein
MRTADFDFELPGDLIAQNPPPARDGSRLLVFDRSSGMVEHRQFGDFRQYLRKGDVLVLNNSRVIPARLKGMNLKRGDVSNCCCWRKSALIIGGSCCGLVNALATAREMVITNAAQQTTSIEATST